MLSGSAWRRKSASTASMTAGIFIIARTSWSDKKINSCGMRATLNHSGQNQIGASLDTLVPLALLPRGQSLLKQDDKRREAITDRYQDDDWHKHLGSLKIAGIAHKH